MYLDIRIPHFSGEQSRATISEWRKQLGDHVSAGDVLATVLCGGETIEVKSTNSGVLVHKRVADGQWILTGAVFAVLNDEQRVRSQPRTVDAPKPVPSPLHQPLQPPSKLFRIELPSRQGAAPPQGRQITGSRTSDGFSEQWKNFWNPTAEQKQKNNVWAAVILVAGLVIWWLWPTNISMATAYCGKYTRDQYDSVTYSEKWSAIADFPNSRRLVVLYGFYRTNGFGQQIKDAMICSWNYDTRSAAWIWNGPAQPYAMSFPAYSIDGTPSCSLTSQTASQGCSLLQTMYRKMNGLR